MNFYFPVAYNPSNYGRIQLSIKIYNSACFSGFSEFNDGKAPSSNKKDHNLNKSFRILCQKYQVYRNRKKKTTHKESINVASIDSEFSISTKKPIIKYR